jgi:hypothetical protein
LHAKGPGFVPTTEKKKCFKKELWRWTVVMFARYECVVIGLTAMCLPTQTSSTIIDP